MRKMWAKPTIPYVSWIPSWIANWPEAICSDLSLHLWPALRTNTQKSTSDKLDAMGQFIKIRHSCTWMPQFSYWLEKLIKFLCKIKPLILIATQIQALQCKQRPWCRQTDCLPSQMDLETLLRKEDDITRQDYLESYLLQMQKIALLPRSQDALLPGWNWVTVRLNDLH